MKHHGADILKTVIQTMVDNNMVIPGESVLVGVSGGVDSVTLLWCLGKLAERFSISRVGVAHLNHGLRGKAADEDMAFVKKLAESYRLPFYSKAADVEGFAKNHRLSTEDAARQVRYDFFLQTALAQGYEKIATGHHADDNAEQVLMSILRGSGPTGLSGIPPVRDRRIIRPFINLKKVDIEAAARRERLAFMSDATNNDLKFLRNRVRHELIPYLQQEFNRNIADNLHNLADICRQEDAWQDEQVSDIFPNVLVSQDVDEIVFSVTLLKGEPPAVQRRIIRKALFMMKGDLRRIAFAQIEAVINCLDKNQSIVLDMPGDVVVAKSYDRLIFCRAATWRETMGGSVFSYALAEGGVPEGSLDIPETGVRIDFSEMASKEIDDLTDAGKANVAFFDLEKLDFPLTVRNVLPGDRFVPLGMTGHQKVKDFFINNKVPRQERLTCPVVVSGNSIIWLAGFRMADHVKITPTTTRVLRVVRSVI